MSGLIVSLLLLIVRSLIVPVEALRECRGERYYGLAVTSLSIAIPGSLMFFVEGANWLFAAATVSGAVWSVASCRWNCFFRDRSGRYWHSYSEGDSDLRWLWMDALLDRHFFTFDFSKLVIEPVAVAVVAVTLHFVWWGDRFRLPSDFKGPDVDFVLPAAYLGVVAFSLFVQQVINWWHQRQILLDHKDALSVLAARQRAMEDARSPGLETYMGVAYLPHHSRHKWHA